MEINDYQDIMPKYHRTLKGKENT